MTAQADGFIDRAWSMLPDARDAREAYRLDVSISNAIESIELSAKATFRMLGVDYEPSHDFKDADVATALAKGPVRVTATACVRFRCCARRASFRRGTR
jgi:hypothetical protein